MTLGVEIARYKYVYDGQGNIVRSIDIFAQKEYTYVYEEGRIVRATESAIILSGEIVTYICMGLLLGRFSRSNIKNHLRVTAAKNMIVPNFAYAYLKKFF